MPSKKEYQERRSARIAGFTAVNDWGDGAARVTDGEAVKTKNHGLSEGMKKQIRNRSQKIVRFIVENWGLDHEYVVDHFCLDSEVDASVVAGFFLSALLAPQEESNIAMGIGEGDMSLDDLGFVVSGEEDEANTDVSEDMQSFFEQHVELLSQVAEVICAYVDNGQYADAGSMFAAVSAVVAYNTSNP